MLDVLGKTHFSFPLLLLLYYIFKYFAVFLSSIENLNVFARKKLKQVPALMFFEKNNAFKTSQRYRYQSLVHKFQEIANLKSLSRDEIEHKRQRVGKIDRTIKKINTQTLYCKNSIS